MIKQKPPSSIDVANMIKRAIISDPSKEDVNSNVPDSNTRNHRLTESFKTQVNQTQTLKEVGGVTIQPALTSNNEIPNVSHIITRA